MDGGGGVLPCFRQLVTYNCFPAEQREYLYIRCVIIVSKSDCRKSSENSSAGVEELKIPYSQSEGGFGHGDAQRHVVCHMSRRMRELAQYQPEVMKTWW
jgi:hypothetical protein